MPTFRAFAYNTGSTISGTEQVGSIAIGTTTIGGDVVWWAGPDEDLGYVIAQSVSGGTMTGADGRQAFLGFYRTSDFTNQSFISLANYLSNGTQNFASGSDAKTWLNNTGYWTSYVSESSSLILFSLGPNITLAQSSTLTNYSWGIGFAVQGGYSYVPELVGGSNKTFCSLTAMRSPDAAIGLDKNGQIWTWGAATDGSLGDNSVVSKSTPVSICGAKKTFCKISFSGPRAIDKYGQIWSWGDGLGGILGYNSTTDRSTPVSICGAKKTFCEIGHTHAIDKYGQVWGWGLGTSGALGNNSTLSVLTPVSICGAKKTFCKIGFNSAIDQYGIIWSWGLGNEGQLGNNQFSNRSTPVSICGARKTFCQIAKNNAVSNSSNLAIDKYGQVWGWGSNTNGVIANDSLTAFATPRSIGGAKKTFCTIYVGQTAIEADTAIAVDHNNNSWAWGFGNLYGNLNVGFQNPICTPTSICGARKTFCFISTNFFASVGLTSTGRVYTWGDNNKGQLGNNSTTIKLTPTLIYEGIQERNYCKVSVGDQFMSAIDFQGRVWGWGYNLNGRLGNNTTASQRTPVSVCGAVKTFCEISSGQNFTISIDKYGKVWGWGYNGNGRLGNNSTLSVLTPVSVCGVAKTFCKIAAGTSNGFGLDKYGQIWSWGLGAGGALGDNSTVSKSTPVSICGAKKTFCHIAANYRFALSIDNYGQIWGWGYGSFGQLGRNSNSNSSTPVSVCGTKKTFCSVVALNSVGFAIDLRGKIWTWGQPYWNTDIPYAFTPFELPGTSRTFCKIFAGGNNDAIGGNAQVQGTIFTIDKDGNTWVWGADCLGESGRNINMRTPNRICSV